MFSLPRICTPDVFFIRGRLFYGLIYPFALLLVWCFVQPTQVFAQKYTFATTYSPHIAKEHTEIIAKSIAYMHCLEQVSNDLLQYKAVKFGMQDIDLRQALAAIIYEYTLHVDKEEDAEKKQNLYLTLELIPRKDDLSQGITQSMQKESTLGLYVEFIKALAKLTQESKRLLRVVAEDAGHVKALGQSLQALWLYYEALTYFQETWREPQKAEALLEKALHFNANISYINAALAEILLQLNLPLKALERANMAVELQKDRARSLYIRSLIHLRLQQLALAKHDIDRALQLMPQVAAWYKARAAVHLALRETENMCLDLEEACSLGQCQGLSSMREGGLCFSK